MPSFAPLFTERLQLRRPDPDGDLEHLFGIFNDPASWWYDPDGRHLDRERTRTWLSRAAARFDTDGLSYWTVRLRDDATVIGVGGAQRQRTRAWNLNYRLATAQQGRGFATEVGRAAQSAAAAVDSGVPFIAWIDQHNVPSRRVAERLGLTNRGPAMDPSDGHRRLAYADRPIGAFRGDPGAGDPSPYIDAEEWQPFVGTWSIEASHPVLPGEAIRGQASFEWMEGRRFFIQRSTYEHAKIPDAIAIIGVIDGELAMHYFDVRGVHRRSSVGLTGRTWRSWRDDPSFAQRFTATLSEDGATIAGQGELSQDRGPWQDDMAITYRRIG